MEDKIITSYKRDNDSDLVTTCYRVVGKMENNSTFPNPPEELAALTKELPAFIASITEADGGDTEKIEIRKAKRAIIIGLLTKLAAYVTLTSRGDRIKLLSSGFKLNRAKGVKTLEPVKELKVTIGPPGQAVTKVKKVAGAKAYLHQYTKEPLTADSEWTNQFITDTSYTFTGLQSKERYLFRVIAIGLKGQEAISPTVAMVIQ